MSAINFLLAVLPACNLLKKASAMSEYENPDFLSFRNLGLGAVSAITANSLLTSPIHTLVLRQLHRRTSPIEKPWSNVAEQALRDRAANSGIRFINSADVQNAKTFVRRNNSAMKASILSRFLDKQFSPTGAFYHPGVNSQGIRLPKGIFVGSNVSTAHMRPGVMAHEMGHALTPKLTGVGTVFKPVRTLATLAGMLSPDETVSRNLSLGASAASLPLLASEAAASYKGSQLLRSIAPVGLKGLRVFNPRNAWVGIPTYLAGAAAPTLMHYLKKWSGGFSAPTSS